MFDDQLPPISDGEKQSTDGEGDENGDKSDSEEILPPAEFSDDVSLQSNVVGRENEANKETSISECDKKLTAA